MRLFLTALHCNIILVAVFVAFLERSHAAQAPLLTVTIHQVSEVSQGNTGEFAVTIAPKDKPHPIILRPEMRCRYRQSGL